MRFYNLQIKEEDLPNVTELHLPGRWYGKVPEEIFRMPNLVHLNLQSNNIFLLPEELKKCLKLEVLNLGFNSIISEENFENLPPNLVKLDLHNAELIKFPAAITKLKSLQVLILSNNKISKIPAAVRNLKSLKELSLHGNNIKTLPGSIGALKLLHKLNVSANKITKIPSEIGECASLSELWLGDNRLKTICDELGNCTKLNKIGLWGNKLEKLPDTLNKCLTMLSVNLNKNNFRHIPHCIFTFKWMSMLGMRSNRLSDIDLKGISNRIYNLDFAHNQIRRIQNIPDSVEGLYLFNNQLEGFPDSLLNCGKLTSLQLQHNKIEHLPQDFGALKDSLQVLRLGKNPVKSNAAHLLQLLKLNTFDGLMSKKEKEKTLALIKDLRENDIPERLNESFFKLASRKGLDFESLSLVDLVRISNSNNQEIKQKIHTYIYKKRGIPLYKNRLKKGHCLSVIGHTYFDMAALEQRLLRKGISFSTTVTPQTTHVLYGWKKVETVVELSDKLTFLSEKSLSKELGRLEKAHLLREKDEKILQGIKSLLMSKEVVNIQLAIEMLKGGGVPQSLLYLVLANWLPPAVNPKIKEDLFPLLMQNVEDEWKFVLTYYHEFAIRTTIEQLELYDTQRRGRYRKIEPEIKKFLLKNKFDIGELKKALSKE
jgi:Leucine-rich repeat (LRR) protein